ncbi:hypothetical protein BDV93DRAFT_527127 [Ceratobasidium sp. AG-I]|nr:hypothetical protein BDV93DRAFT_527127 [Ceratobasidium sp. AG-I]
MYTCKYKKLSLSQPVRPLSTFDHPDELRPPAIQPFPDCLRLLISPTRVSSCSITAPLAVYVPSTSFRTPPPANLGCYSASFFPLLHIHIALSVLLPFRE